MIPENMCDLLAFDGDLSSNDLAADHGSIHAPLCQPYVSLGNLLDWLLSPTPEANVNLSQPAAGMHNNDLFTA